MKPGDRVTIIGKKRVAIVMDLKRTTAEVRSRRWALRDAVILDRPLAGYCTWEAHDLRVVP